MHIKIPFKEKTIEAEIDHQDKELKNKTWVVLTHGAGGDLNAPQLTALSMFLSKEDFVCLRFTCKSLNLKYRLNVFAQVLTYINNSFNPGALIVGGRSMGARVAASLSNNDIPLFEKIKGTICLSYPLHKTNQTKELRDEPLKIQKKPIFFLSGSADEMCKKDLLEKTLLQLKCPYKVLWLEGYNHSAKPKENFSESIYINAFETISNWCKNIT